jgi:hypothetical protein
MVKGFNRRVGRRGLGLFAGLAAAVAISAVNGATGNQARAAAQLPFTVPSGPVAPNPLTNNMDCNGWSSAYQLATPAMRMRCVDPIAPFAQPGYNNAHGRFYDNGHYVGHDEPTVKFISGVAGSGNNMTYFQELPVDPAGAPTSSPSANPTVSVYNELSPAPWFGLPMCDSNSYPTVGGAGGVSHPCTADSDANHANNGGSAFMELQFYPPGNGPWFDAPSIDQNKWGVAVTIDSFEVEIANVQGNFVQVPNPNCTEPVNVAFLTHDGIPMGPPSPQQLNDESQLETADTLLMSPGDTLKVSISDTASGMKTQVDDITTGQSGSMVASGANGFMNTDPVTCNGSAYDFHPEYNTASAQNQVPWAALDGGVLMQQEIGHFEPCASLSNADPVTIHYSNGDAFADPNISQTCNGGFEAAGTGEGPCVVAGCSNGASEGGTACSTGSGPSNCESSDGFCFPKGSRTVTITPFGGGPQMQTWTTAVAGCTQNRYQNGDLDYDGSDYVPDWPDGSASHPTSFRYIGPFDGNGNSYPQTQFQTDVGLEEASCNSGTGAGCTAPPAASPSNASPFYPFWTLTNTQGLNGLSVAKTGACVWNFGNDISGLTQNDFGKSAQYGSGNGTNTKATLISPAQSNPEVTGNACPSLTLANITVNQLGTSTPEVPWAPAIVIAGLATAVGAGLRRQRRAGRTQ